MTGCDGDHPESAPHQHDQHDHSGGSDEHGHGVTASSDGRLITIALALIGGFLLVEVVMAFVGHSLALLADAGHMRTDASALGASLLAIRLARRPASGVWTFGFKRAEVLSAQANGITLLVISALVACEAISRLIHPLPVAGGEIVAAITSQPGVASVHDVQVWLITSGFPALSAHVLVRPPADCHQVRRELEQLLCEPFALDHTTLQVDQAPDDLLTVGGVR